jgi:hypothetical protein
MENHPFLMGKSTINGLFSIAMSIYRRVLFFGMMMIPQGAVFPNHSGYGQ